MSRRARLVASLSTGLLACASFLAVAPAVGAVAAAPAATAPSGVSAAGSVAAAGVGGTVGMVAASRTPDGKGMWAVTSSGAVEALGDAVWYGDVSRISLNAPIVSIAATSDGRGYWLLGADGGVFSFGDAHFYGSTGGLHLNAPALQIVSTPDSGGYWFVAGDGGVFSFGDARFFGSTGGMTLNKPVVGMSSTPDGAGYWLVASDGGIFSFGDAHFYGSTGNISLAEPIVGMAASLNGGGYWLVASDGGVFTFGDASFEGSLGGNGPNGTVSLVPSSDGLGYWEVLSVGEIEPFGDAPTFTSPGALPADLYDAAEQEWLFGAAAPDDPAMGAAWGQALTFLQNGQPVDGSIPGYAGAISALQNLVSLPDAMDTPAQDAEFATDFATLNTFFNTPGLYESVQLSGGSCSSTDLEVSLGQGDAGLGHVGIPIVFTNIGTTACTLYGYPGVAMLDSQGEQVVQATRTLTGYLGGLESGNTTPPVVTLLPLQSASALVEGLDAPQNGATTCPIYPAFQVTPPGATASMTVSFPTSGGQTGFPGCVTPEVHPVVSGTNGQQ
jgi:hypothetical protein